VLELISRFSSIHTENIIRLHKRLLLTLNSGTTNCTISGKPAGKKFYHNAILGSAVADEEFYVAVGTRAIHDCMGGIEVYEKRQVVREKSKDKQLVQGLHRRSYRRRCIFFICN